LLELSSSPGNIGGLLLPKVALDDLDDITVTGGNKEALKGLIVYNTTPCKEGVYVWDGTHWNRQGGTPDPFCPSEYLPGLRDGVESALLSGITCFDISSALPASADYIVTIEGTATISKVRWILTNASSISLGSASTTANTATQTLLFDTPVEGNVTVTAYIDLDNAQKFSIEKTVKFQNRSCCSGNIISKGVWNGDLTTIMNGSTGLSFSTVRNYFTQSTTEDLCLAPSDESGTPTWADAKTACANKTTGEAYWRLPNVAELGQLQDIRTSYGMQENIYWSVNDRDEQYAWGWKYDDAYARYGAFGGNLNVRCVRNL
jgi:hypothetical protein